MKMVKSLILGSAASLLALGGAQAADLPVKAKAVEYVRICSLYGAGFWYIPGTDTCIRIGGAIRLDVAFHGNLYDAPFWQGSTGGAQLWTQSWFNNRERLNLTEDTRTATEYGLLRTYANLQFDWTSGGVSAIAGGAPVEVDLAFIQFAGFTLGKSVSQFDPQWTLTKPTITSGLFAGSNNATGIPQLAYTASFGNGVSGTISLEDGQPYRTAGVFNAATQLIGPFQATTLPTGAYGVASFTGNAVAGDHVPDIVGNLRLDQAWGTLHFGAAAHEVHGNYNPLNLFINGAGAPLLPAFGAGTNTDYGHVPSTYGYAVTGAIELKNLPTGAGDSFKAEATFAHGAAKYVWGGTIDTAGAGRFAHLDQGQTPGLGFRGTMAFGYVLDSIYFGTGAAQGANIGHQLSDAWEVSAFYEHYWTPQWRTSLFGNYSQISYGGLGDALLKLNLSTFVVVPVSATNPAGLVSSTGTGHFVPTPGTDGGSMKFATAQVGTRTAWQPVKDLTFSAEFIYTRMIQNLNGSWIANPQGAIPGSPVAAYQLKDQNLYNFGVQANRSF